MSRVQTSYWPSLTGTDGIIGDFQTFSANVPLQIITTTGNYSNPPQSMISEPLVPNSPLVDNPQANLTSQGITNANGPYYYPGIFRKLRFSSANDISDVTFRITGLGFTANSSSIPIPPLELITEDQVGPVGPLNTDTVNYWARIDSIVPLQDPSNPIFTVLLRQGATGLTNFHKMDTEVIEWHTTVGATLVGTHNLFLNYAVYGSLTGPEISDPKSGNLNYPADGIPQFQVPFFSPGTTVSQINPVARPYSYIWARVNTEADGSDRTLSFKTIQQGVRS